MKRIFKQDIIWSIKQDFQTESKTFRWYGSMMSYSILGALDLQLYKNFLAEQKKMQFKYSRSLLHVNTLKNK